MRRRSSYGFLAPCFALVLALGGCASTQGATGSGDAKITAAVQAQVKQHPALAAPNHVYVSTRNGTVYLSGQVSTDLQRQEAEAAAREVAGVTTVVNTISLMYGR